MANLSVIIPTVGRNTLVRTLDSIAGQRLQADDQILVCADTYSRIIPSDVKDLVDSFGPQFSYHELNAGENLWGNPQRNAMIPLATSDWVLFQDDDDVYNPNAFDTIRSMADNQKPDERAPMYFRFEGPSGALFWREAGLILKGAIGGHCIVAPRGPRLATWGMEYTGDWDYCARTSMNFKDLGFWYPHVISTSNPPLGWLEATSMFHAEALRIIRNTCRETLTRNTAEISEDEQRTWFMNRDLAKVRPYLYTDSKEFIGSGLITIRDDNLPWVTVCVMPDHRDKHLGRHIFRSLSYAFPLPVYAEIDRKNIASLKACLRAGYEVEETNVKHTILKSTCQNKKLEDAPR